MPKPKTAEDFAAFLLDVRSNRFWHTLAARGMDSDHFVGAYIATLHAHFQNGASASEAIEHLVARKRNAA